MVAAHMFIMSLGFSIVLTGVWPYLTKLDPSAGKEFLGLAVAAHPLGQMVTSPLAGRWGDRGAAAPLRAGLLLGAAASALYAELQHMGPGARYWLLTARFLVGAASANVAVVRAYLSTATLLAERTKAVAAASLAQVLGFAVGPALQAALTPLGPDGDFNMYTAAGWLNALLCLVNLVFFLPACFKEHHIAVEEARRAAGESSTERWKPPKPDKIGGQMLVAAFFALVFNFVLLETLGAPLTMDQFGWSESEALQRMGVLMSVGAVVACLTFAAINPLSKVFEERALLVWGGFTLTALGSLLCIPWGPDAPPVRAAGSSGGGCPAETQPWCSSSLRLQLGQFLAAYACVSLGYPLGVTLIQTIFSKALGPRPQGLWMGVLTGAGCLSRVLGPVCVSVVYARWGPAPTFSLTAGMTLTAALCLRLVYARLTPLTPKPPAAAMEMLRLSPAEERGDNEHL